MYPKQFWNEFRIADYPDKIFVGMSFEDKKAKKREEIIKAAIKQAELSPLLLKDIITGDSIPIDIMEGIIGCKLVLFDVSPEDNKVKNRNENVMYEIGLAHTWRNKEEVILIGDDIRDLPFDIQSMGVEQYSFRNRAQSIDKISNIIRFRIQEIEKIFNSKVIKAATSLTIETFQVLMSSGGFVFVPQEPPPVFYVTSLPRLLDLGLVEFLTDSKPDGKGGYTGGYGYYVTELGRAVIRYFGFPLSEDNLKEKYPSLYKMKYGILG